MNKKTIFINLIISVIVLITMIHSALALTTIFNSYIYNGDTFFVNGKNYFTQTSEDRNTLIFKLEEDKYAFVEKGECSYINNLKFCFNSSAYDYDKRETKYLLKVYQPDSDLSISRTISDPISYVGEKTKINLVLKNDGTEDITNIDYVDIFPPQIKIIDVTGSCQKTDDNKIIYNGDLKEGEDDDCEYEIQYLNEINTNLRGYATYNILGVKKTKESSLLILNSENFVDEKISFKRNPLILGEENYMYINLTNKEFDKTNKFDTTIIIPKNIELIYSSPTLEKIDDTHYKISGNMYSNSTDKTKKVIKLKIKPTLTGNYEFIINSKFTNDDNFIFENQKATTLRVRHVPVSIFTSFDSDDVFNSGYDKILNIWIQNPTEDFSVKLLNLKIYNELNNVTRTIRYSELTDTDNVLLSTRIVKMPDVKKMTKYKLHINLSYKTEEGATQTTTYEKEITVKPAPKIEIKQSFSDSSIEGEEKTYLTVELKNTAENNIDGIKVSDIYPSEMKITGASYKNMDVDPDETKLAYKYEIETKNVKEKTKYPFITNIKYKYLNITYDFNKTIYLTVVPKTMNLKITQTIDDKKYIGQRLNVYYTIKNEEDESVKNIKIYKQNLPKIDWVNDKNFTQTIANLDSREELKIKIGQIRFKENETQYVPETNITFFDYNNNFFEQKENKKKITGLIGEKINAPAIIPQIVLSNETIMESKESTILLKLTNKGTVGSTVKYDLNGKTGSIYVPKIYTKNVIIKKVFNTVGEKILTAKITYNNLQDTYTTEDTKTINVVSAPEQEGQEAVQTNVGETKIVDNEVSTEKKGIDLRMPLAIALIIGILFVISLLFMKKRKPSSIFLGE